MGVLDKKVESLISEIPTLIKKFHMDEDKQGPDLYFYKKTMLMIRENNLEKLLEDKIFIECVYATLVSWGMNARGAKMKYFDDFFENIKSNKNDFIELSKFKLENISKEDLNSMKSKLGMLFSRMILMHSGGRLVSNSKTMHFILPDLVMPIDRENTLEYFYGNTGESKKRFLKIFEHSWEIAKNVELHPYLDDKEWNQSIPKIIDNSIIQRIREEKSKKV